MLRLCVPLALLVLVGVARPDPPTALGPAETIFDGSDHSPILFPTFADLDGDGTTDLLVGTINRLLVVRNRGTNVKPEYAKPVWLDESVPSARIPDGWSRGEFSPRVGDFDGDGRLDLVSGSNCCDPATVHLFLRQSDGSFGLRQEVKFERPDVAATVKVFARGRCRPHLFDWDRDGTTDLVIANLGRRSVLVSPGPLAGKAEVAVKAVELPAAPDDAHPVETTFADWDGDGAFDVLVAGQYLAAKDGPWRYAVYWFRNTAAKGEPKFAAGARLVTVPEPWGLNALTVVDRDLVVSVSKAWERKKGVGWTADSKLWRYRRQ